MASDSTNREEGVPIATAARLLGLSTEAVRKRLSRQTLRGYKRGHQWFVLLPAGASGQEAQLSGHDAPPSRHQGADAGAVSGCDADDRREVAMYQRLVETLQDEIAFLRRQLQERDDDLRRKDALTAALLQRVGALPGAEVASSSGEGRQHRRRWSWWPW